jgi:hypothetical protein
VVGDYQTKMDSLGRRVYQVDNRTFERELKSYFDNQFHDRVSSRSEHERREPRERGIVERGVKMMNTIVMIARFIFMILMLYLLYSMGRKLYEDMEAMNDETNEPEGDAFDKMFGSEFKGKFKNARQNKGVFQARQEEIRMKNLKEDKNTTPPQEIRNLIHVREVRIVGVLKSILQCSLEDFRSCIYLRELAKRGDSQNLFRILYRGYTFRELLSPKIDKLELLREASDYILHCISSIQDS